MNKIRDFCIIKKISANRRREKGEIAVLRRIRRKIYRKIRFKTWYRKCRHYNLKHGQIDSIIAKYKSPEELEDKKYLRCLRRDMTRCLMKYGAYYDEYFQYGFEGKDDEYRSSFITEGIRMSFYPRMNDPRNTNMLENKYLTYKKFREFFKRDMLCIRKDKEPGEKALEELGGFTDKHREYIVKPIYAAFGKGVYLDKIENYASLEEAFAEYSSAGAVLEELIEQGEEMAVIHPQSVNTLRIPTAVIKDGEGAEQVVLFNPTLRVGQHDSVVDNFSAGGISALIDPESGRVFTHGADKKGHSFRQHPDTGVSFEGFQIPAWDEAVSIVKRAAMMVPGNHYCGWDLAYTAKQGWCMVEANCTAQMGGMQLVTKTGRRWELEALIAKM